MALGTLDRRAPPLFRQGPSVLSKLLFFISLALFLMVADQRFGMMAPVRMALSAALAPAQAVANSPIDFLQKTRAYFVHLQTAQQQAADAQAQLAATSLQLAQVRTLQTENERLRQLLSLRTQQLPRAVAAQVIYDAADPYTRKVIMDKGRLDEVALGSPVLDSHGVLGQVSKLYLRSAEVSLLVSQDYTVPVRNARTGATSVAYGAPTVADGRLELRHAASNADIQVGDALVTSGIDGIYPPNIPVGVIEKIERRTDSAFARVYCKPVARMSALHLLVVAPTGTATAQMLAQEQALDERTIAKKAAPAAAASTASAAAGKAAKASVSAAANSTVARKATASAAQGARPRVGNAAPEQRSKP